MNSVDYLQAEDRQDWELLARGYKAFYKSPVSDEDLAIVWQRLLTQDGIFGLGARLNGQVVGIAHYLFHTTVWASQRCYLQDLFTLPAARGQGVARSLIKQVAANAREGGVNHLYWHTQADNETARKLYDKVAKFQGFLRYEYA